MKQLPRSSYLLVALCLAIVLALVGCTSDDAQETKREKALDVLENGQDGGELAKTTQVQGESFSLANIYTTDYDIKSWKVTKPKTIKITSHVINAGEGSEVYIEHVHADVSLMARRSFLDGVLQDSMDDSLHAAVPQPGFLVSGTYPYEEVFSIEGLSKELIDTWRYYRDGAYTSEPLNEVELRDRRVTGNKLTFVYDLMIRYPGETAFHKRVVVDEFRIPIG